MKEKINLNNLQIDTDGECTWNSWDNNVSNGSTEVFFRDIKKNLYKKIMEADSIMGCIAWLTDFDVLDIMGVVPDGVQLVVQKEDFLRPDIGPHKENWKDILRIRYNNLKSTGKHMMAITGHDVTVCGDGWPDAVKCVGNHNSSKSPAFPRMHNKFMIFFKKSGLVRDIRDLGLEPYAVWTGSYNITNNAGMSFENAIYITDKTIVNAYFNEFKHIMMFSESLDWTSEWIAPEYRLGT